MRIARTWLAGGVLAVLGVAIPAPAGGFFPVPQAPSGLAATVVNSDAGPCTADFVVSDSTGKAVYNAKIDIQIRYGFGGFHRINATVGTNADGKARMEGLPDQVKRATQFEITYGGQSKSIPYDPLGDCHSQHKVVLDTK